jgi:sugar lactone lactonase YvrE
MHAFDRGTVERFATLPPGEAYPEGIDADADGNVYVVTVGANKPDTSPGSLFVFDPNGKLLRTVHLQDTSPWLLDLRFQPNTGRLLVVDYRNPKVFTVDPETGATSVFMTVTGEDPGLDGLTFDADGNVYVTAAHQGVIWRVGKDSGAATAWSRARFSSQRGRRPPSVQTASRSIRSTQRYSSPTPHKTRSSRSR